MEEWIIPVLAIGLVMVGLIGQGFEMRKIRMTTKGEENLGSPKIFTDKKNFFLVQDVAVKLQKEVSIAASVEDGYERYFFLPDTDKAP